MEQDVIAKYNDINAKSILITGANRGIGLEIAKHLARQGAHIVYNYRNEEPQDLNKLLLELGAKEVTSLKFDLANTQQMKEAIDYYNKNYSPLSGLVNNAGISKDQMIFRLKEEDLQKTLDINLRGTIMLSSLLSRSFLKAKDVSIVNISSIVGLMGNPGQVSYSASKAGLIGLTKSYAKELASRNIRCNCVCPGFIETKMTDELADNVKEAYLSSIPLKRFGQASEVAQLVSFLLSKASSYITGQSFKIDGGIYI